MALRFAEGFSTITMQLARNLWPEQSPAAGTGAHRLTRKLREAKVALEIERLYPKDRILELYLNQIGLGNGAYGVEAAAQRYFGKSARDLNVAEAATLAALPQAPTRYNPRRQYPTGRSCGGTWSSACCGTPATSPRPSRALEGATRWPSPPAPTTATWRRTSSSTCAS